MKIPFVYGKLVEQSAFVNRTEDINFLLQQMQAINNIILISPRRWGKTSLVRKTADRLIKSSPNYKVCFLDLNKIQKENDFYKIYAEAIINATSSKLDETFDFLKNFFKSIVPKLSINPDPNSEISLSMDWDEIRKSPDEILNLPEYIAKKKKIKIIVCLDEFQNVSTFKDPIGFQKKLRSVWQKHQEVAYCIYGSKRHMMLQLFGSAEMPFFKFGTMMFMEKIAVDHWAKYIQREFKKTKKKITLVQCKRIAESVEQHSYYVQQVAQLVWFRTGYQCSDMVIEDSITSLQLQLSMLFQQITDTLSKKQINFLRAIINEETELSSQAIIAAYDLGTSGTVAKVKSSLEDKDIIDNLNKNLSFNDPVYKLWLKNYYFT